MDGVIAQQRGDLGEIVRALPDHALGRVDLQRAEVFHCAAARLFPEDLLQIAAAHQIVPADVRERQAFCDVVLQIFAHTVDEFLLCAFPDEAGGLCGGRGLVRAAADEADEQLLDAASDELLGAEGRTLPPGQLHGLRVVERRGECGLALLHDARQQGAAGIAHAQYSVFKKTHGLAVADKTHHNKIGRHHTVGRERVELARFMENDLPFLQMLHHVPGTHIQLTLVHIQKFPEIVALPFKIVIAGIFKIMHGDDIVHRQRPLQPYGLVAHASIPPFCQTVTL